MSYVTMLSLGCVKYDMTYGSLLIVVKIKHVSTIFIPRCTTRILTSYV
jgi:hypothetical protein